MVGVTEPVIRELAEVAELAAVARLFESIWRREPGTQPVTVELLRAMAVTGNYVAGAFDGDDLLGACFGFLAQDGLHSHIAGVTVRGRGIGLALKRHQREWALGRGLDRISWTFDPLVRRNAHFNLTKLGARPVAYLPDFYGPMPDGINGGEETDRLMVHWELADYPVWTMPDHGSVALSVGESCRPVAGSAEGDVVLVAVPPDIEALRRTDPALARSWRSASREVLHGLMSDGAEVVGFDSAGRYVIVRER
jgi:predicted GNAT superfamily acetyltransferase